MTTVVGSHSSAYADAAHNDQEWALLTWLNADRAAAHLAPLQMSSCLHQRAQTWAAQEAQDDLQSEDDPAYASYFNCATANTAIARGANSGTPNYGFSRDPCSMEQVYMQSPGHKMNNLGPYNYVGVGWSAAASGRAWTAEDFLNIPQRPGQPVVQVDTPPGGTPGPPIEPNWGGWETTGGILTSGAHAASWGPGRLDVFARGSDAGLWHTWWINGVWQGRWESFGGILESDPRVVSWGNGRLDVFAVGTDYQLWHAWWINGTFQGWEPQGYPPANGNVPGAMCGPAVSSWGPNRLDVFVRDTNGALWHHWFDGKWEGWENLGGSLESDPSAVSWGPNRIDVVARGTDDAVWHYWFDGAWHCCDSVGGSATSAPEITSRGAGTLDVFSRGTDAALWHRYFNAGWSNWTSLGGPISAFDPGAVSWGGGRLDVFARGNDGGLWHAWAGA